MMTAIPDLNLRQRLAVVMHVPTVEQCQKVIRNLRFKHSSITGQWKYTEAVEGAYEFGYLDNSILEIAKYTNEKPMVGLFMAPAWVDASLKPRGEPDFPHVPYLPPNKVPQWEAVAEASVSRYNSSVDYWNLDCETNVAGAWKGTPEDYAQNVIIPAAKIIRRYEKKVVAPGITIQKYESPEHYERAKDHMRRILALARPYIDILSVHSYAKSPKRTIDQIKSFVRDCELKGSPVWVTETGFPETWYYVSEEAANSIRQLFISGQERQLERFEEWTPMVESMPGIGRTFIWRGFDVRDDHDKHSTNGLLNWRLKEKLAAKHVKLELMKDKVKK